MKAEQVKIIEWYKKLMNILNSFLEIYVRANILTHKHWLRGNRFMKKFQIFSIT